MGFLDKSGDIILDAVLTDLGRKRLAEGSFSISRFALGDEEINYALYNKNHPSGSAYYDLEIIQTPVLESFTNNSSTMKTTLLSLNDNKLFYLPVLKLNTKTTLNGQTHSEEKLHLVAVDEKTQGTDISNGDPTAVGFNRAGVLFGFDPTQGGAIVIDQGIDNLEGPSTIGDLKESLFIIQIDGRFGEIVDMNGDVIQNTPTQFSTTDDDMVIQYTVDESSSNFASIFLTSGLTNNKVHDGVVGNRIKFKIQASTILRNNFSYFERFGFIKNITSADNSGTVSTHCIDSIVRVTGVTYGSSIDIPVRFIKHL